MVKIKKVCLYLFKKKGYVHTSLDKSTLAHVNNTKNPTEAQENNWMSKGRRKEENKEMVIHIHHTYSTFKSSALHNQPWQMFGPLQATL